MERRHLFGSALALTGLALAAVQVVHGFQQSTVPLAIVVDAAPLTAVALALAYAGVYLARTARFEPHLERIAAWGIGGVVVFLSLAALSLFGARVVTGELVRAPYVAIDNATVGATSGVLVGLYDARSRLRTETLARERERMADFAAKAADMNNYGRAIANAGDVAAVSAYCIEAAATLLGVRECLFLEATGSSVDVVDNTAGALPEETLESLAATTRRLDVGAVTAIDDPPAGLGGDDAVVLSALLYDDGHRAAVFVAATGDHGEVTDVDRDLLELLVSHARVVLDGLYAE